MAFPPEFESVAKEIREVTDDIKKLRDSMASQVVGQQGLIDRLLVGLFSGGHVLLEGVPGLAKTLAVKTLASSLDASFQRIQFTPDLLPSDIVGTLIYNPQDHTYETRRGPVFANILLADEVNRAPAKVQSALLEAMQEHQVTLGDETFKLPAPFLVLATENPIEQQGTYPLAEAQLDRFMLKVLISYPTQAEERGILDLVAHIDAPKEPEAVLGADRVLALRQLVEKVHVEDKIKDYIVSLVCTTRGDTDEAKKLKGLLRFGASPRATINLTLASKALAFLQGRAYVVPEDIKDLAPDILRHRLILSYEALADETTSEDVIEKLLEAVPVP